MISRTGILLVFCCLAHIGWAQEPRFIQHEIGDANSNLTILTMLQDRNCMLWLGTEKGLARYDGMSWVNIPLPDTSSDIQVTAMVEDHLHQIWIGTSTGHIFRLSASRAIESFEIEEGHPAKPISSIVEDQHGQLWFATYGEGVYVYSGKRMYNIGMEDGLSGNDLYAMTLTQGNQIWLGTDDGISICTFELEGEKKSVRKLGLKDGLPDQIITSLKADDAGNVYIGTFEFGLVRYDAGTKKITSPFPIPVRDEITAIEIFDGRELWFGTRSSGVWRYMEGWTGPKILESAQALHVSRVTDLLSDVEGNIWMTMNEGGLISAFRPFESLVCDVGEIQSLFCDHADQLWIGTQKGLYRVDQDIHGKSKTMLVPQPFLLNVTDILEDRYQQLWIGTLDRGLFIFRPSLNQWTPIGSIFEKGGITIMSMAMTSDRIWIATLEGVVSYPVGKNILQERDPNFELLSDPWQSNLHFVYQIYVDQKGRTWFATDGKGVFCIDGVRVSELDSLNGIRLGKVYSICEDERGHMWFNTVEEGLVEYDGNTFKTLKVADGLGNLNIASILMAGTGDIVLVHNRGIDLMEPDRRHFMYFGEEIGAKEIEPGLNTVALDRDNNVYIGCRNVVYKYFATHHELSIHPRTQLTKVSVFDEGIDISRVNRFAHNQNYLTFEYVGLWYTSPSSVKYLYKLEGYDLQWKESKDNVASYSHLSPGPYTFSVKASENNFFLDEPIASYSFTISKPFWLQYWFMALAGLAGAGLMYWLVKSRENRSERQALLKKEMVESQLSALKAQINPHFLFNSFNTLITIIDENARKPDVAIEYVEKLSDFYRSILQYREQESISLEEEFDVVQNFAYLLEKRYGHHLRLHVDKAPADAYILPLTLQILVENAVKHNIISEQYPLDVFITVDADQYVTVKNNLQPKSKAEPSTQFGLQSIIKQYQLLSDRKVIVHEGPRSFEVRIPIIKRN